jgi:hypothetical protein
MANNIGTHLSSLLDEIEQSGQLIRALANIGIDMETPSQMKDFQFMTEFLANRHIQLFDDFRDCMRRKVLPVVAHINYGVAP